MNHTFGGNNNFNMMLRNGGTLYIDEGKPVPALIGKSVANLADVSPTFYLNVPRGFAALLDVMDHDDDLQQKFFKRLDMLFYAAAALPQTLWERLEKMSVRVRGKPTPFISSGASPRTRLPSPWCISRSPLWKHRRARARHAGASRARQRQA